jgi:hypothetical protein
MTVLGETYQNVKVAVSWYMKGGTAVAVQLFCEDGEPLATASVYLGGKVPQEGCFWARNTERHEVEVVEALVEAGMAEMTGRTTTYGWDCRAVEMRLL